MKIALVQDWLVVDGGAEKIIREIINMYPNVDVFSLVDYLNDEDRKNVLNNKHATTSFIQSLPFSEKGYRNYLPLFPLAIQRLNFTGYDIIISSSYAVAKGIKKTKNQFHICYCHSPIRYAWDLYDEYISHFSGIKKLIAKLTLKYIRKWDLQTTDRVDVFIANSNNVAERIKRIYKRDSIVIYPPVDTKNYTPELQKENYYFTSARLVAYKKIDLMVEVFNQLPHLKLIVSGNGPEFTHLNKIAKSNITFTGFLKKNELIVMMQKAKAFVLAADEDFGITSIEAQSCCTPVIAYKKGGYLETVIEGKTGMFFTEQTVESIKDVILKFESSTIRFNKEDFKVNVDSFSIENFQSKFKRIVENHVERKIS